MKTVAEIRNELKFAKDNGLTAAQIEALEIEMIEAETIECTPAAPVDKSKLIYDALEKVVIHRDRNSTKAYAAAEYLKTLEGEKLKLSLENINTIYKKHTANQFFALAGY